MKTTTFTIFLSLLIWASGNAQTLGWVRNTGGTNNEYGSAVAVDNNGNVYIAGAFEGTVDFDPGSGTYNLSAAGNDDIFIQKLDAAGNFLWAKSIGSVGWEDAFGMTIDNAGNVYVTGYFDGSVDFDPGNGYYYLYAQGGGDIFVLKLNSSGNFVWAERMGGNHFNAGYAITADNNNNIYVTGLFYETAYFSSDSLIPGLTSAGDRDVFVAKLNSNGHLIWAKGFGGSNKDYANSIAVDNAGNVYTTGVFNGTADFDPGTGAYNLTSKGHDDVFVSKLNSSGNLVWAKALGGSLYDMGYSIAVDNAGSVYTTGFFTDTADFDPGSGTYNLTSTGSYEVFVSKLNSSGNFAWARKTGGPNSDKGYSVAVDDAGHIYTTGYFNGTASFGQSSTTLTSAGGKDIFIQEFDTTGNIVWAKNFGGSSDDVSWYISTDNAGNIYNLGVFQGLVNFDPGNGTSNLISSGGYDIFIQKINMYALGYNSTSPSDKNIKMQLYPNPNKGKFTLEINGGSAKRQAFQLEIFSATGALIYSEKFELISSYRKQIDLENLSKGVYFLKLRNETGVVNSIFSVD